MMEHKIGQGVNLLLNVVMGIVLGITGQVLQGICSPLAFIQTFCLTMGIGFLLGTYIPVMQIGQAFAAVFGLSRGCGHYLVSTLAVAFVMVNVITLVSVFIQAGSAVFTIFRVMIVPFLVVGILAIEACLWWIQKLVVQYYTGK